MTSTYAVKWREPDGQTYVGSLALGARMLRLEGRRAGGGVVDRQIGYEELRGLHIVNHGAERLDGRPALVVERADGRYLVTSAGTGAGVLQELIDRLAELRLTAPRRATFVVPLKEGALDRVRRLVAKGPPFDPAETPLTRHQLLLTEREAIFVFEAQTDAGLAALLGQLEIWAAAAAWDDLVEGPLRLAEVAYASERPELRVVPAAGLAF